MPLGTGLLGVWFAQIRQQTSDALGRAKCPPVVETDHVVALFSRERNRYIAQVLGQTVLIRQDSQ
jgi:hypothetical protein